MDDSDHAWPDTRKSIFTMPPPAFESPTGCSIKWMSTCRLNDSQMSSAYKRMADHAISHLERGEEVRHPDNLFMPIANAYRHSLELLLKHLVRRASLARLIELDVDDLAKWFRSHNLHGFWCHVRAAIETMWPDGDRKIVSNTEALINDLQRIDKSGQNLRYTRNVEGQTTAEKYPDAIELTSFRDAYDAIYNLLDACTAAFDDAVDSRAEMEGWSEHVS